ncbi:MAG: TonB-dependent receptor, partial [Sinomicrobium sp.]|nr:TonB-dependent receptor [Sinomicrobium sp.]
INGKHYITFNAAYLQNPPVLRNTFSNARQNHDIVKGITPQKTQALDVSYIIRSSGIKSRLTGYYNRTADASEIAFFFVDGLNGDTAAFVQEVLTGIEKRNRGLEFGMEAQLTPAITVKGAAAIGEFIYNNDPVLYLTSTDFEADFPSLRSRLKNYKIPGGPQQAYSAGFEYRDPDFW